VNLRNVFRYSIVALFLVVNTWPARAQATVCDGGIVEPAAGLAFAFASIPVLFAPNSELALGLGLATANSYYDNSVNAISGLSEGRWDDFSYQSVFRARTDLDVCQGAGLVDFGMRFAMVISRFSGWELRGWGGAQFTLRSSDMFSVGPTAGSGLRKRLMPWLRFDTMIELSSAYSMIQEDSIVLSASWVNRLMIHHSFLGLYLETDVGIEPFANSSEANDEGFVRDTETYVSGGLGMALLF